MKLTAEQKLKQLEILEKWCLEFDAKQPENYGSYDNIGHIVDKTIRDGIIFWNTGRGWRLRKNPKTWKEVINQKRAEYTAEHNRFLAWFFAHQPEVLHEK
jgi:hypothetical protein